jgi:hypothetical protein
MSAKKKDNPKKEKEIKPFSVKNYHFYPCIFSSSTDQGFVYYLQSFDWKGILQIEQNSPRFKSMKEAFEHIGFPFDETVSERKEEKPIKKRKGNHT